MSENIKAHFLVVLATFLIGGSFIASAKLSGVIDPISLTLLRFVFASIILAPLILLKQKYRSKIKQSFQKAMVISLFYSLYFIGLFKALEYTTALNTATLFTLVPLLTAIFAIFAFKQKITLAQLLIYIIGIVGTCMVIFKGNLELFFRVSLNYGDIIFLFAIVSMVFYSISARYLYTKDDDVLVLTFMTLIGGSLWMSGAMVFFNIPLEWYMIKGNLFFYMTYLTIGATLITVFLNQQATVILGSKKVMAYVYLSPATVAVLLYLFQSTAIPLWSMVGIFVSALATIILLFKS